MPALIPCHGTNRPPFSPGRRTAEHRQSLSRLGLPPGASRAGLVPAIAHKTQGPSRQRQALPASLGFQAPEGGSGEETVLRIGGEHPAVETNRLHTGLSQLGLYPPSSRRSTAPWKLTVSRESPVEVALGPSEHLAGKRGGPTLADVRDEAHASVAAEYGMALGHGGTSTLPIARESLSSYEPGSHDKEEAGRGQGTVPRGEEGLWGDEWAKQTDQMTRYLEDALSHMRPLEASA